MLNEGLKRCVDCGLYPNDCGYWKKPYRKKNPNLPKKEDNHNCDYFKPKQDICGLCKWYFPFFRKCILKPLDRLEICINDKACNKFKEDK